MNILCENNGLFEDSIIPNLSFIISQLDGRIIETSEEYDRFSAFVNNQGILPKEIDFRIILADDVSTVYDFKNMKRIDYDKVLKG